MWLVLTASKPLASLISVGSLHARPKKEIPTGSPNTKPAGTLMLGYPATAAAVEQVRMEAAIAAAQGGITREVAEEISYLAGLKPMTGAKIFTDPGGEALAIMCKATGLPRSGFCMACYDGDYPVAYDPKLEKNIMERRRARVESLGESIAKDQLQPRLL